MIDDLGNSDKQSNDQKKKQRKTKKRKHLIVSDVGMGISDVTHE